MVNNMIQSPSASEAKLLYDAALRIADGKLDREGPAGPVLRPRLGTGGNYSDLFLWDTAFCVFWAKYHPERYAVEHSLDNFYRLADSDGFISRQYLPNGESKWSKEHPISFAPPLLAWAELELHRAGLFPGRLARNYPVLKRHHEFCAARWRQPNGMFFSDPYGCGLDNLPRWPSDGPDPAGGIRLEARHIHPAFRKSTGDVLLGDPRFSWNRQANWIDATAQMAFNAANLAEIAEIIGRPRAECDAFLRQHAEIADAVNRIAWDPEAGFYFDTLADGTPIRRFFAASYWTLIAGIVPPERLDRYLEHLVDPAKFARPVPVPTLAADDPDYDPENGYSCGPVWAFMDYMILCGLRRCGRMETARLIAARLHAAVWDRYRKTGTIWENYSPEQPDRPTRGQPDFCGWSALAPITVYREFLAGTEENGLYSPHRDGIFLRVPEHYSVR